MVMFFVSTYHSIRYSIICKRLCSIRNKAFSFCRQKQLYICKRKMLFAFTFMKHDMKGQKVGQWISDEVHFAVLAIESAAKKMNISPMEMQRRLKGKIY